MVFKGGIRNKYSRNRIARLVWLSVEVLKLNTHAKHESRGAKISVAAPPQLHVHFYRRFTCSYVARCTQSVNIIAGLNAHALKIDNSYVDGKSIDI